MSCLEEKVSLPDDFFRIFTLFYTVAVFQSECERINLPASGSRMVPFNGLINEAGPYTAFVK